MTLEGKVVVITGAARGMGRAYTHGFLDEGCRVVCGDLSWSGDGAEETQAVVEAAGGLAVELDITRDDHIEAAFAATMERFGTVDVLLNNAGMRQRHLIPPHGIGKVLDVPPEDWRRMFDVNVFGTLAMIRTFVQPMLEKRAGSIINVSTTGTDPRWYRPHSREQPYMASKSALTNLSIYLANEIAEYNVAVNVLFPPHAATTGTKEQDIIRKEHGIMAAGAVPLVPEAVVPLAKFFAAQTASTGVTGKVIYAADWNLEHGLGGPDKWLSEG